MEGDTSFRPSEPTPAAAAAEVFPISDRVHPADEMPPSLYLEAHKTPLVLELLDGTGAYEQFDMKPLSQEIDSYVIQELRRLGLEDTRESYQQVLERTIERLKLPEGTDIYATVEKLARLCRIQTKLYSALMEKEELMAADPMELSAAKLKLYIERGYGV